MWSSFFPLVRMLRSRRWSQCHSDRGSEFGLRRSTKETESSSFREAACAHAAPPKRFAATAAQIRPWILIGASSGIIKTLQACWTGPYGVLTGEAGGCSSLGGATWILFNKTIWVRCWWGCCWSQTGRHITAIIVQNIRHNIPFAAETMKNTFLPIQPTALLISVSTRRSRRLRTCIAHLGLDCRAAVPKFAIPVTACCVLKTSEFSVGLAFARRCGQRVSAAFHSAVITNKDLARVARELEWKVEWVFGRARFDSGTDGRSARIIILTIPFIVAGQTVAFDFGVGCAVGACLGSEKTIVFADSLFGASCAGLGLHGLIRAFLDAFSVFFSIGCPPDGFCTRNKRIGFWRLC